MIQDLTLKKKNTMLYANDEIKINPISKRRVGNLLPTRFYSIIGNLKNILHCCCIDLRYPKIIFNFVSLIKNNFRRLPRRAFGTARNDELGYRVGILAHHKAARL